MDKNYTIAVAGTGYVGLSIATLLSQHHKVYAVDIVPSKVELINQRKSPIQDDKMLMNYGYDSVNCFTLILCGEAHLNNTLNRPVHEALRQRVTVHYNFCGLSDDEVARYVLHKITCAGGSGSIMDNAALSAIHSHSQGNPRLIDNLMSDALALGSQMEKKTIDAEVVLAVVNNQNLM